MSVSVASVAKCRNIGLRPRNWGFPASCRPCVARHLRHMGRHVAAAVLGLSSCAGTNPALAAENRAFWVSSYFFDYPSTWGGRDRGRGLGAMRHNPTPPHLSTSDLGEAR